MYLVRPLLLGELCLQRTLLVSDGVQLFVDDDDLTQKIRTPILKTFPVLLQGGVLSRKQ